MFAACRSTSCRSAPVAGAARAAPPRQARPSWRRPFSSSSPPTDRSAAEPRPPRPRQRPQRPRRLRKPPRSPRIPGRRHRNKREQERGMTLRNWTFAVAAGATLVIAGCKTTQAPGPNSASDVGAGTPAAPSGGGSGTTGSGGTGGGGTGSSIPTLVNVNLQNVLNDLSVAIKVDRANIPVNAQVPIDVAANVCGVSVSALAASIASGQAGCTAKTTSPQLTQAVQQQVAAGGSVTGGPQTMGSPTENKM